MRILSASLFSLLVVFGLPIAAASEDSEECIQAREEAESTADVLATAASSLHSCATNLDLEDDCSYEMSNAQSAHSDYESSVADVSSYCE
ncbi:hypothetical protein [Aeromonas veronii]|uniref:Uncharacterized protein n=1 Tax=Aeromonas veronii TaxID=654 RepID=A0AAW5MGU8_AERVE|nr:hypothetical protein [Aeromonas veronii]ELV7510325.1 hypothetical protein [Aeromonas veronii]MCR4449031.1 hypothetical protein [Aeromonas veronii]